MRHLVILVSSSLASKEARLTHVKVETFEASIAEPANGTGLANVALGLMAGRLGSYEPMQNRQPDHALRLLLHPVEEMKGLNQVFAWACFAEAAPHRGLHVGPTKGGEFAQNSGDLDAIMQQKAQFSLCSSSLLIRN